MNTAEMQQRLQQSLANDRVVDVDAEKISHARAITNVALEVSDQSFEPRAIVAKNVWFMAQHDSNSGVDKKMLMLLADTAAQDNKWLAPITPDDLLRTKLALSFAFDHAFPQRSAALRKDQTSSAATAELV